MLYLGSDKSLSELFAKPSSILLSGKLNNNPVTIVSNFDVFL